MARVVHKFGVLDEIGRVWAALADFSKWDRYLKIPDARKRGWGDSFVVRQGSGRGMELAMLSEGQVIQDWVVETWEPPQRLRLANRACYGNPVAAMRASLDFSLSQVSQAETSVTIAIETTFTDPGWGWFFNLVPIDGQLRRALDRMSTGIVDVLQGA